MVVGVAKQNSGKVFESDISSSIPNYCMKHRLRDSAQSFTTHSDTKFSWDNECDFFVFDTKARLLYAIECKTTKYKSMNWESEQEYEQNKSLKKTTTKLIKYHQIKSLNDFDKFDYLIPCFILNFRNEDTKDQRTYFIHIKDFMKMINSINKKSFDEMDLILNGAIKIHGLRKRTRYAWDINEFLCNYGLAYANK